MRCVTNGPDNAFLHVNVWENNLRNGPDARRFQKPKHPNTLKTLIQLPLKYNQTTTERGHLKEIIPHRVCKLTVNAPLHIHTEAHIVKQNSIHASLKWQDVGIPSSKWTGLSKFNIYLEFTALQWIPILFLKHVSTSTSLCACLGYKHHYSFLCIWGCSSNEISLAQTTPAMPVVYIRLCMLGSDLTQWLPNQTCQYTWIPLDYTGTTLADAIAQWSSNGNPMLTCIIGTHWKTTGATSTLGCHWNHTGWC